MWRFDYRYGDKRKAVALGPTLHISLADARQRREDAKKLLANGIDPGEVKKAQKAATVAETENSFEIVAREWHSKFSGQWSTGHAETIMDRLTVTYSLGLGQSQLARSSRLTCWQYCVG